VEAPTASRAWTGADAVALAVPLALSAALWWPILGNYFHADDFLNLYQIATRGFLEYVTQIHGGHVLLVRNAVFWAMVRAFGPDPRPFFVVVLATHLLNVALLFVVVRRLTASALLACLAAAAWGTSPLNTGALGWYAVYGHVLAATLLVAALADVARVRPGVRVTAGRALGWGLLLLAASVSFGVGIGVAAVFPLAAVLLLPRGALGGRAGAALGALPVAVAVAYVGTNLVSTWVYGRSAQTVLTLLGMLRHWPSIVEMLGHLMAVGCAALVPGSLTGDAGYPRWTGVAGAAAVAAAVAAGVVRGDALARRRVAGLVVLAAGGYAVIAAGRAELFVDFPVFAPDLAHAATTVRYHYFGPLAVAAACAVALAALRMPVRPRAAAAAVAGVLAAATAVRAARGPAVNHWDADRQAVAAALDEISAAVAAAPPGGDVYLPVRFFMPLFIAAAQDRGEFPGSPALFVIFHPDNVVDGRRVHFVTSDPRILRAAAKGPPRLRALFVRRAPAAAAGRRPGA
jgi:hypothetical protein